MVMKRLRDEILDLFEYLFLKICSINPFARNKRKNRHCKKEANKEIILVIASVLVLVLEAFSGLHDKIASSKIIVRAKRWLRKNKKEIMKDILVALTSALIVIVSMNAIAHKEISSRSAVPEDNVTIDVQELAEPVAAPEQDYLTEPYKLEAEEVARVLYGTARWNSEQDQRAVVWCIINRCESSLYPNTIEEVCRQPSQWMAFSEDNPVVQDLYDLANEELTTWHNGGYRMIAPEFMYMSWSQNEIVLRTSFVDNSSCRYWKAK